MAQAEAMPRDDRSETAHQYTPALASLLRSLERLLELIEEENAVLSQHRVAAHANYTDRKNQVLRELVSVQRVVASGEGWQSCIPLLVRLKDAMARNASLLKIHISAVSEVSDIIVECMQDSESDGTYSRYDMHERL